MGEYEALFRKWDQAYGTVEKSNVDYKRKKIVNHVITICTVLWRDVPIIEKLLTIDDKALKKVVDIYEKREDQAHFGLAVLGSKTNDYYLLKDYFKDLK